MDQQQIYSNTINEVGGADVTLWTVWHDTVLVGVAPHGGVPEKVWLRQGEIIEIDERRWVMLDLQRAVEITDAKLMIQLVAVE